jgi:hypothetical protein
VNGLGNDDAGELIAIALASRIDNRANHMGVECVSPNKHEGLAAGESRALVTRPSPVRGYSAGVEALDVAEADWLANHEGEPNGASALLGLADQARARVPGQVLGDLLGLPVVPTIPGGPAQKGQGKERGDDQKARNRAGQVTTLLPE